MKNLEASSNKPVAPSKLPLFAFPILGAVGFSDATYLTVKHFLGTTVPCSILHGCEQVLSSKYSSIWGIPVALFGSLYYLTILILAAIYIETRNVLFLKISAVLTCFGFAASLGFVYLQIFVIKSICLYCMGSALTSTLLFIAGMIFLAKHKAATPITQNS